MKQRHTKAEDVSAQYGRPAWRYTDGSVRGERGHMIVKLDNHGKDITRQNAHAYAEARANKVQEAIRTAIMQAGAAGTKAGPAEVVGAAAGIMWADMMRGVDANGQPVYMRDRIKVWETVGKQAGLLEAERAEPQAASNVLAGLMGLALGLAAQRQLEAGSVVDADSVTEAAEAETDAE